MLNKNIGKAAEIVFFAYLSCMFKNVILLLLLGKANINKYVVLFAV